MAKDIGMIIRKGIVVSFLPCLVGFWRFHPYMFFHFFKCFFVTCFCCFLGGGRRKVWIVVWMVIALASEVHEWYSCRCIMSCSSILIGSGY